MRPGVLERIEAIVSATVFDGRLDSFAFASPTEADGTALRGRGPVMIGPNGSFGVLIEHPEHGRCIDYVVPGPMRMGAHWHGFDETLIGVSGEVVMTVLGEGGSRESHAVGPGDRVRIGRMTPHRADVAAHARYLVVFGAGWRCTVDGEIA